MKKFLCLRLLSLFVILSFTTFVSAQKLTNITTGFIGNTFSGSDDKWVMNYALELDVASDGTMITGSEWDEDGRCVGIFKDGQPVTIAKENNGGPTNCWGYGTATEAVAVNDNYLYVNNCDGNILRFDRANNYNYIDKFNTGVAVGMTCSGSNLYMIQATGLVQKRSVSNLGSVALSFTVAGGYDLAVDASGNIWVLTTNKEVLKYNSSGTNTGTKIAAHSGWEPSAVNYDAYNDLLLVPDNGSRRQVIKFNTSGTQVGTFGDLGGISAGTKGIVGDKRFWNISGCGTDANGNIYVALNENCVSLRKFNSSGVKQWEVLGTMFCDIVSIDPASDGTDMYSINEHMKFDYTSQQWSLTSMTCDRINNPTDPRNSVAGTNITSALMRRVSGNLLMYTASMYAGGFDVYKFNGEIAVLSQSFTNLGWAALPDKNGNIWYTSGTSIKKIPLTGFSGGSPVFGAEITVTTTIPAPFTEILRLEYNLDADIMYISGYTNANPDPDDGSWGLVGSTIARYPNWNTGNRTASNTALMPRDESNYYPKAMSVSDGYIFVGGSRDRGKLYVFNASNLAAIGTIEPPTTIGTIGWIDMVYAVQAFKKSNGQYVILVEDNARGKNLVYQWDGVVNTLVVTVRGESSSGEGKANLIDNNLYSKWLDLSATSWVQFEYAPSKTWNSYSLTSGNDAPGRDPKNWTLQGSNNGSTWTTLDTRTNNSFAARNATYTFNFTNSTAYKYYKFNITANNGDPYIQLSEISFSGTVTTIAVTGVTVNPTTASIAVNATSQLTATVAPTNATNKSVNWSTSNSAIATVSTSGLVTGKATGTATITVTTADGGKTATCAVTVTPTATLRNPENPANTVNGLDYKYYHGTWDVLPNFSSLGTIKTGNVTNFDLSPRTQNDFLGFQFLGYVNVSTDGIYTFYTSSDDGSKLYIGSTLIVNNDGLHGSVEVSGTIGLKAGKHAITVDFFEKDGGEVLDVSYSGPSVSKQLIPNAQLFRISSEAITCTITARGENAPNEGISKLTDGSVDTKWLDFSATSWVLFNYSKTQTFNTYDITSANDASVRDPKNWTIQGSNDGTNWTTLDTRTNQSWATRKLTKTFNFTNTTSYKYYKWNISANQSGSIIQAAEFKFPTAKSAVDAEETTSISSNTNNQILIYPNPANNVLHIENINANTQISIYSIEGKLMFKNTASSTTVSFDVTNWNKGLYIINIYSNTNNSIHKVLVK